MQPTDAACATPSAQMQDYIDKAKRMSENGSLRAYLVAMRTVSAKGDPAIDVRVVVAPTWSHVASRFDNPKEGCEIIEQKFLAPGVAILEDLLWVPRFATGGVDPNANLAGLGMCSICKHDFREQPSGTCRFGHRTDKSKADDRCPGFVPKVA
jgi:hypothetical protein